MKMQKMNGSVSRILAVFVMTAVLALMVGALTGCSQGASNDQANNAAPAATNEAAADSAAEGDITVHVTMKQDVTSPEAQDSPIQFAEESIDVAAPNGATALEVLQGTDREVVTAGSGDSTEVTAIGDLANGAAGEGSHWTYTVNGQEEKASPAVFTLSDGDTMVWTFVAA